LVLLLFLLHDLLLLLLFLQIANVCVVCVVVAAFFRRLVLSAVAGLPGGRVVARGGDRVHLVVIVVGVVVSSLSAVFRGGIWRRVDVERGGASSTARSSVGRLGGGAREDKAGQSLEPVHPRPLSSALVPLER
jgi:hypothetical protein